MKLLAFETSSERGTVALLSGEEILERQLDSPREQTKRLLPAAQALLAEANLSLSDLDAITFGRGPGSFTGLRIAAAAAQGLALAAELPLLPISSLLTCAQGVWREHGSVNALICMDAHMGEVFWASCAVEKERARILGRERLTAPEDVVPGDLTDWTAAGDGFEVHRGVLESVTAKAKTVLTGARPQARDLFPFAASELASGGGTAPEEAVPTYLRAETAWKKAPSR